MSLIECKVGRKGIAFGIAIFCGSAALFMQLVAIAVPKWYSVVLPVVNTTEVQTVSYGLWKACNETMCFNYQAYSLITTDPNVPREEWLDAVRAFALLASTALVLVILASILIVCGCDCADYLKGAAIISCLLALLFILLEVSVFGAKVSYATRESLGFSFSYQYCFALAIVAMCISIVIPFTLCWGRIAGKCHCDDD